MRATTIKLEGDLLKEIEDVKRPRQSVTGFVREALMEELKRRKMSGAARRYVEFLSENHDEKRWMEEWEAADLTSPHRQRKGTAKGTR